MRVRYVELENYRGFEKARVEWPDRPGVFAIAGANGAGKSSVLDVIADLNRRAKEGTVGTQPTHHHRSDVRDGGPQMRAQVMVGSGEAPRGWTYILTFDADRDPSAALTTWGPGAGHTVIHYPSNRTLAVPDTAAGWSQDDDDTPKPRDPSAFVADMPAFFRWFRREEDLENEARVRGQGSTPILDDIRATISSFLADAQLSELRVERSARRLAITKAGHPIDVNRLSDGERRMLLFSADLTRRLRAAAGAETPLTEIEATVLIDELELHLHPRWQRSVVAALTRTYPACQFIVTTHSPLIISELPTDQVTLLDDFRVIDPAVSTQGRDINTVVEQIMGGSARPERFERAIAEAERLIDAAEYTRARTQLAALEAELGQLDAEVVRLQSLVTFLDEAPVEAH